MHNRDEDALAAVCALTLSGFLAQGGNENGLLHEHVRETRPEGRALPVPAPHLGKAATHRHEARFGQLRRSHALHADLHRLVLLDACQPWSAPANANAAEQKAE